MQPFTPATPDSPAVEQGLDADAVGQPGGGAPSAPPRSRRPRWRGRPKPAPGDLWARRRPPQGIRGPIVVPGSSSDEYTPVALPASAAAASSGAAGSGTATPPGPLGLRTLFAPAADLHAPPIEVCLPADTDTGDACAVLAGALGMHPAQLRLYDRLAAPLQPGHMLRDVAARLPPSPRLWLVYKTSRAGHRRP